jgi:hypothetical protein
MAGLAVAARLTPRSRVAGASGAGDVIRHTDAVDPPGETS